MVDSDARHPRRLASISPPISAHVQPALLGSGIPLGTYTVSTFRLGQIVDVPCAHGDTPAVHLGGSACLDGRNGRRSFTIWSAIGPDHNLRRMTPVIPLLAVPGDTGRIDGQRQTSISHAPAALLLGRAPCARPGGIPRRVVTARGGRCLLSLADCRDRSPGGRSDGSPTRSSALIYIVGPATLGVSLPARRADYVAFSRRDDRHCRNGRALLDSRAQWHGVVGCHCHFGNPLCRRAPLWGDFAPRRFLAV